MDVCVTYHLFFSFSEAHRTTSRQVWNSLEAHKCITTFSMSRAIILETGPTGSLKGLDGRNKWRDPQPFLWTHAGPWSLSQGSFEFHQTQFQMQMGVIYLQILKCRFETRINLYYKYLLLDVHVTSKNMNFNILLCRYHALCKWPFIGHVIYTAEKKFKCTKHLNCPHTLQGGTGAYFFVQCIPRVPMPN